MSENQKPVEFPELDELIDAMDKVGIEHAERHWNVVSPNPDPVGVRAHFLKLPNDPVFKSALTDTLRAAAGHYVGVGLLLKALDRYYEPGIDLRAKRDAFVELQQMFGGDFIRRLPIDLAAKELAREKDHPLYGGGDPGIFFVTDYVINQLTNFLMRTVPKILSEQEPGGLVDAVWVACQFAPKTAEEVRHHEAWLAKYPGADDVSYLYPPMDNMELVTNSKPRMLDFGPGKPGFMAFTAAVAEVIKAWIEGHADDPRKAPDAVLKLMPLRHGPSVLPTESADGILPQRHPHIWFKDIPIIKYMIEEDKKKEAAEKAEAENKGVIVTIASKEEFDSNTQESDIQAKFKRDPLLFFSQMSHDRKPMHFGNMLWAPNIVHYKYPVRNRTQRKRLERKLAACYVGVARAEIRAFVKDFTCLYGPVAHLRTSLFKPHTSILKRPGEWEILKREVFGDRV